MVFSSRISIQARTFVSMALMLGVIVGLAALNFRNGAEQQARSERIRTHSLRVVNWSNRLAAQVTKLQNSVVLHFLATDRGEMANLEAVMQDALADIDKLWSEHDQGPPMADNIASEAQTTRNIWAAYRPEIQAVVARSWAGEKALAQQTARQNIGLGQAMTSHLEKLVSNSTAGTAMAFDAAEADYGEQLVLTEFIVAFGCALALGLSLGLVSSLRRLTASIIHPVLSMAEGRFELVPRVHGQTELGRASAALETLRASLVSASELQARELATRQGAEDEYQRLLVSIASEIDSHVGDLVDVIVSASAALEERASEMLENASVAAGEGNAVAGSVDVTLNNVQIVAAASEELAAVSEGIAMEAQAAAGAAARALDAVKLSEEQASELLASANEISTVVQLVNAVAAQTNLLALNATIEAARAGDAGRGFAVVAGEVKLLAEETSRATGRITEQVDRLQKLARRSAELTLDMKRSVEASNTFSLNVRVASDEQRAAISEIAMRIEETAVETERVSSSILTVRDTVLSSRELAEVVVSSSRQLVTQSSGLLGGMRRLKLALLAGEEVASSDLMASTDLGAKLGQG
jgi:methyl-accepting chemotaxis protein